MMFNWYISRYYTKGQLKVLPGVNFATNSSQRVHQEVTLLKTDNANFENFPGKNYHSRALSERSMGSHSFSLFCWLYSLVLLQLLWLLSCEGGLSYSLDKDLVWTPQFFLFFFFMSRHVTFCFLGNSERGHASLLRETLTQPSAAQSL